MFTVLGILSKNTNKENSYLTLHVSTAGRLVWAQLWKDEATPADEMLINKIMDYGQVNIYSEGER